MFCLFLFRAYQRSLFAFTDRVAIFQTPFGTPSSSNALRGKLKKKRQKSTKKKCSVAFIFLPFYSFDDRKEDNDNKNLENLANVLHLLDLLKVIVKILHYFIYLFLFCFLKVCIVFHVHLRDIVGQ